LAELQKDPITRGQFLWMGTLGTLVGAVLTIPPIVYVLDPTIDSNFQGQSDIPDEWQELGSVFEIPSGEPKLYRVEFPQNQTYNGKAPVLGEGSIIEAILVSWRDGKVPDILENRSRGGEFSTGEIEELAQQLNVMSNHCAHLGCPVRWFRDRGEILCPCHGGIYDINGGLIGGPPPQGLYYYAFEIREGGGIYVKHDFTNGEPYVV
jgi:Rieske Fe-S protein